jgi:peptidoglycan/LPS O-acetylase OafA/YrhL
MVEGHVDRADQGNGMIAGWPVAKKEAYFAYIDGLRAVSIVAVVLFHLEPHLLPGGFAGVDVFFVVSGFIISGALHDRSFSSLLDLFATFYARRFRRIVPALLFMLVVTCALVVCLFRKVSQLQPISGG